jgi:hypothetical protein
MGDCAVRGRGLISCLSHPNCPHLTWGQGWDPCRACRGLRGLRFHFSGLRLTQGPAQGLCLSLKGAVALLRKPELKLHTRVGLLQEDLAWGMASVMAQPLPSDPCLPHLTDPNLLPLTSIPTLPLTSL